MWEYLFFHFHFWRLIFLDIEFFVDRFVFSFSILNVSFYHLMSFIIFYKKWVVNLIKVSLYSVSFFVLAAFKISSFNLSKTRLGIYLFVFILLDICWASCISRVIFYFKFLKISVVTSKNIPSTPSSLSSSSGSSNILTLINLLLTHVLWHVVHFLKSLLSLVFRMKYFY